MKISVVTAQDGSIVATMRHAESGTNTEDQPEMGFVPERGQTVQVLELPKELEHAKSTDDFHRALQPYLGKSKG